MQGLGSLQDLGSWGSNLLGQASTQLAPAAAAASGMASSSLQRGADLLSKGTKAVKASLKEGVSTATFVGASHSIDDPRLRSTRRVTEVQFLAEGGFGVVMKVTDNASGEAFALKKIRCQEGVQVASSFAAAEREAKILTSLSPHPNIIQCLGYAIDQHAGGGQTVKVLMEYCTGGHLLDFMDRRDGKLSAREVLEIFVQITSAVQHLHSQSPPIQHRDLKVENVLRGSGNIWKLCDFGSCSTQTIPAVEFTRPELLDLQEEIDKTVTMLYRPPEMADIQLNFRKGYTISEQVDIWMLGCILYTLAFYRHPFQDNPTAMAITNGKYFIPSDHELSKSKKLCGLIHWLLAADPKHRPPTGKILQLLPTIGKLTYEDMLASMPEAVCDKIRKLDIYSARRDTGDIYLPSDLSSAVAAAEAMAKGGPGPAQALKRASTQPATASGSQRPTRDATNTAHTIAQGDFDLAFALAPSSSSSSFPPVPEPLHQGKSEIAGQANGSTTAMNLWSLNAPPIASAAPAPMSPPAGELGDLLDFGFGSSAPSSAPQVVPSASTSAGLQLPIQHGADWSADFGNFSSAPSLPATSPQRVPSGNQLGGMSPMGALTPARSSSPPVGVMVSPGFAASAMTASPPVMQASPWMGGMGLNGQLGGYGGCASPVYAAPATSAAVAFACDFADFTAAPAPPAQTAGSPGTIHPATADRSSSPAVGNLLDF